MIPVKTIDTTAHEDHYPPIVPDPSQRILSRYTATRGNVPCPVKYHKKLKRKFLQTCAGLKKDYGCRLMFWLMRVTADDIIRQLRLPRSAATGGCHRSQLIGETRDQRYARDPIEDRKI